jgi:hypothetical protein
VYTRRPQAAVPSAAADTPPTVPAMVSVPCGWNRSMRNVPVSVVPLIVKVPDASAPDAVPANTTSMPERSPLVTVKPLPVTVPVMPTPSTVAPFWLRQVVNGPTSWPFTVSHTFQSPATETGAVGPPLPPPPHAPAHPTTTANARARSPMTTSLVDHAPAR